MKSKWIIFFIIMTISTLGIYLHTNTLTVSHHKLQIGSYKKKLRLAHISDLHTKGLNHLEKQLIEALDNEKPDLIVITGDLSTPSGKFSGYDSVLKKLHAPIGIFYVPGNWEYWEPINKLDQLLKKHHIRDLNNKSHQIDRALWLVGFDDKIEGSPEMNFLELIPKSSLKIGLFHSPIFFKEVAGKINLNLSGHSHGGQIRLPFLKPFWVPEGTGKYDQGWFEQDGSKLFVSRGIGTSIFPIRFNCSPELAIIDIEY